MEGGTESPELSVFSYAISIAEQLKAVLFHTRRPRSIPDGGTRSSLCRNVSNGSGAHPGLDPRREWVRTCT